MSFETVCHGLDHPLTIWWFIAHKKVKTLAKTASSNVIGWVDTTSGFLDTTHLDSEVMFSEGTELPHWTGFARLLSLWHQIFEWYSEISGT